MSKKRALDNTDISSTEFSLVIQRALDAYNLTSQGISAIGKTDDGYICQSSGLIWEVNEQGTISKTQPVGSKTVDLSEESRGYKALSNITDPVNLIFASRKEVHPEWGDMEFDNVKSVLKSLIFDKNLGFKFTYLDSQFIYRTSEEKPNSENNGENSTVPTKHILDVGNIEDFISALSSYDRSQKQHS